MSFRLLQDGTNKRLLQNGSDKRLLQEATGAGVSPAAITIDIGATTTLTASGFTGGAVTWASDTTSVATVNGSGIVTGIAHHQPNNQTATITATGVSVPAETATCVVTVNTIFINASPDTATIAFSGTQQLTATVTGGVPTTKTWTIQSGGGSVDSNGLYTAPSTATTAVVRATSVADTARYDESTISVEDVRTLVALAVYDGYTGLDDGTLGYLVYELPGGTLYAARSTVGLNEIGSTGTYEVQLGLPTGFVGVVLIEAPPSSGLTPYVKVVEPDSIDVDARTAAIVGPYGVTATGLSLDYTLFDPTDGSEYDSGSMVEFGSTGIYGASVSLDISLALTARAGEVPGLASYWREIDPITAEETPTTSSGSAGMRGGFVN